MTDEPMVFIPDDEKKPSFWVITGADAWDNAFNTSSLTISQNDDTIVTFHSDGTVEVNPKYSSTEAAQAFWDAVRKIRGTI